MRGKCILAILLIAVISAVVLPVNSDSITGSSDLKAYYFDGSYGLLNPSDGKLWNMTVTGINASGISGNKVLNFLVQDHGTGSGWETLAIQVHVDFNGAGGHLLQSYDKNWVLKSSHGFNPGDVLGKFDLRMLIKDLGANYEITPQFRLPASSWTTFFDGSWTSSDFELTKTRLAMQIDAGGAGTVIYDKPLAYSEGTWYADPNTTIQAAIAAASSGETVKACKGTYSEALTISKPLNAIGADADTTIINGSGVALSSAGLVRITANSGNVKFSGFTVCNAGSVGGVRIAVNVGSNLAGITYEISGNKIYGSNDPDEAEDYGFYSNSGQESLKFHNNVVSRTGANNIVLECHTGPTEIAHNTLDAGVWGVDPIFYMTYGGVDITTLQNVSYNDFDMGTGGPFEYDHRATGISFTSPGPAWGLTEGKFTNMVISGNVFVNLQNHRRGIGFWNAGTGDNLQGPKITGNAIAGVLGSVGSFGIDFYGLTSDATISENTINGTEKGITLRSGTAPGTKIFHNNICNNTIGLDWSLDPAGLDAGLNWWGDPTGPYHPELNPQGKGNNVSDYVGIEPWLTEPYPPAEPVEALLYVDPATVEYWTPAYNELFTVDVKIANVTSLAGYEFKLYWDTSLLDLSSVEILGPWDESHRFVGKNETREDLGRYWISVVAILTPSFDGSASLVRLTFRIRYDPLYPENEGCKIDLGDTKLSESDGDPIYHMVHDGRYDVYSTKPELQVEPPEYKAHALNEVFEINVTVHDVVNLYVFNITLSYNTTLLDATDVSIGAFLSSPSYSYYIDDAAGFVRVYATSSGGAPPANGSGTLFAVTFKVTKGAVWHTRYNEDPPLECDLALSSTLLKTSTGYQIPHDVVNGRYLYEPKAGDVDMDGKVGLTDLRTVAYYYDPNYNIIVDLNRDSVIDVYDLSIVASHYGES
jgi:hypothetical protein